MSLSPAEKNPEIDPANDPKRNPVEDPDPGHRGPVNDPAPDPAPEPDAPEPPSEAPHGDPPSNEPPVHAAPLLVLTSKPVPEDRPAKAAPAKPKKQEEQQEQSPFSVTVGQVYDGPLDLLLDLIRKQDIDIYDIPIAKITAQFLAYVNKLKATDMDVAGEFIYTASLLIHIKSKMLLPRAPAGPDDASKIRAANWWSGCWSTSASKTPRRCCSRNRCSKPPPGPIPGLREFKDDAAAEPEIAADTVDLVRIFRDILERARKRPIFNVEEDSVTVGQMIQFLTRRLTMEDKPLALRRLLSHTKSPRALVAMFLALLELVRLQAILLRQDRAFSEIFIKKSSGFDSVVNEGLTNSTDEWR